MDNYSIADNFSLLAKLMDVHGENSFKSKSYASAAFSIERLPVTLSELALTDIAGLKGIGSSSAKKIAELLETGRLAALDELIANTPPGVMEMMNLKGLGPKKINTIWKEIGIESVGELLYACRENRLKLYKGFGEKTQQNVIDTIEFYERNKGHHLYAAIDVIYEDVYRILNSILPMAELILTGDFAAKREVVHSIDFLTTTPTLMLEEQIMPVEGISIIERDDEKIIIKMAQGITVKFLVMKTDGIGSSMVTHTSSKEFYAAITEGLPQQFETETELFEKAGLPYIPPHLREYPVLADSVKITGQLPDLVSDDSIRGLIHCHSNWSDGSNTIEEMAIASINMNLQYMLITDHSRSAFYANGLQAERVFEQHKLIDELNAKLAPFRIFKGIESDILNDGRLDYEDDVLSSFDIIIASIHSNFKMTEDQATERICRAVSNKFTSILGHPTGRLLLSRNGYPVNFDRVFDACKANNVAVEINANPHRLDLDRSFIREAVEKGLMLSINPDSHATDTIAQIKYGVITAQKGLLPESANLSSFSLSEFEAFVEEQKAKRN